MAKILSKESGKTYGEALGDIGFGVQEIRFDQEEIKRVYGVSLPYYPNPRGEAYHVI